MSALLEAREVVAGYRGRGGAEVRAVDGVSIAIDRGETLALVGESGCGKTTLARALVRLVPIRSGQVLVGGADLATARAAALREIRRTVQIVFQDPYLSLNSRMSVARIVAEPLAVHGLPEGAGRGRRRERARRAGELLELVGLPAAVSGRRPAELSGGERQRVAIARALALDPRLVILDEPVSSLDPSIGAQIMALLGRLRAERGLAFLLIAHDLAVVRETADRVAVMELGRIVESAPAARLYAAPRHPRTRALLSAAQLLSPPPWAWPGSTTQA
jgi:ABC-type glutathione transport system ATPase component